MNELRHLILVEGSTVLYLNEAGDVIIEQTELQTQRKPHAFLHYLVTNKILVCKVNQCKVNQKIGVYIIITVFL